MLPLVAPSAVIELSFDPIVTVGDWAVRLETLGVAVAIFVALVVAALIARRTPVDVTRPADAPGEEPGEPNHLRADDLLYIAVAAVPGAVIGARLGYALVHLDFYRSNAAGAPRHRPGRLPALARRGRRHPHGVDRRARMLGAPLGRWLHALVLPRAAGRWPAARRR